MNRLLPAPRAEFFELNFALNFFLVFARVVIAPFANGTAQRDKVIRVFDLCHMRTMIRQSTEKRNCLRRA